MEIRQVNEIPLTAHKLYTTIICLTLVRIMLIQLLCHRMERIDVVRTMYYTNAVPV